MYFTKDKNWHDKLSGELGNKQIFADIFTLMYGQMQALMHKKKKKRTPPSGMGRPILKEVKIK